MTDHQSRRRPRVPWFEILVALLVPLVPLAWKGGPGPPDHWKEVAKARRHLDRGRPDLAFWAVSKIRDDGPGAAEGLTLAARALLMQGNVSLARKTLEHSLRLKPDQADAAKMLAAIYLASGDGPLGIALLKQAARLDPGDFRPWYAMGKVYHDLGNLDEAAESYAQAIRRSPPAAEEEASRIGRIRALLDASRDDEADRELAEAREHSPEEPQLLGLAARLAGGQGRGSEALELADRALAADPDNFDALLVRARQRHLAGEPDPALADLEHAIRINPNHLGALQLLVQVQTRLGLDEQAEATAGRFRRARDRVALMDRLTKEINRRPHDPEPRWRMGQAAAEGGMSTLAYQCFQAALDIDPNYQPARESLANLRANGLAGPAP
jgi:tetratricopeptide (TPR) repeat protein